MALNSTDLLWWDVTLHYKHHMVGGIGTLFGSTFASVKAPGIPGVSRLAWFQVSMTDLTMLNDEDYR